MTDILQIGDVATLSVAFTVVNSSALIDPTTVTLRLIKPVTGLVVYTFGGGTVLKTSTGLYYANITLDVSGRWYYRYEGTGAAVAGNEGYFDVADSQFYS